MAQNVARKRNFEEDSPYSEEVVKVFRCSTVVKGGRRFSFAALVVVGNKAGEVGYGYGKANEVPPAVEKAIKEGRRSLRKVSLQGTTIPHAVTGCYGATKVVLMPAEPGTGVIAGASARAVLEMAGVHDVLTKVHGSTSPKNVVKATFRALVALRSRQLIEELRGVSVSA